MVHKFFEDKIPHNGYTYLEYRKITQQQIDNTNRERLDKKEIERFDFVKLNEHRSSRIDKLYNVLDEEKEEICKIDEHQIWLVITENWCGDSAQNLPYIAKIASLIKSVDLRIILRDSHPEVMDLYLTNGTRSIPKLIVFDAEGNEKFSWGPRPKEAQRLFKQWKAEGIVKPELYEKLHLWYSKDKGKCIEKEILQLIKNPNLEVV
jgi:Thioredoxin